MGTPIRKPGRDRSERPSLRFEVGPGAVLRCSPTLASRWPGGTFPFPDVRGGSPTSALFLLPVAVSGAVDDVYSQMISFLIWVGR
jgi:hypothetical protein